MRMRLRSTIERRRDRQEFVYKHRRELGELIKHGTNRMVREFVRNHARPELSYKDSTYYLDIYCTIKRDYLKLFNEKW